MFAMKKFNYTGSIVALVTPMREKGDIDYIAYKSLIQWHLESDTVGIVILGTTGEAPTIAEEERNQLIKIAVELADKKIPIIVGAGTNDTKKTERWCQQALNLGADAVLLVTPYYNKPTQRGLYEHYKYIAHTVDIPIILYNVPSRTGVSITIPTLVLLSEIENIVAVKEADSSMLLLQAKHDLKNQLMFYSGDDASTADFIRSGGHGAISVTANICPNTYAAWVMAAVNGDVTNTNVLTDSLRGINNILFIEPNPIPVKYVLYKMGLIEAGIRMPLHNLSNEFKSEINAELLKLDEIYNTISQIKQV